MRDLIELTKPRVTWLILMSTAAGYHVGGGPWHFSVLFHTLLGTALLASGTAVLNEWYEREADAKMLRTRQRPIPSGRIAPRRALLFGLVLSTSGFADLALKVNATAALCGLLTLAIYLFLYTPLKQRTSFSVTVGALAGAMPPLIGNAGAHGTLTREAWAMFAILFLWQFPHVLSIAWRYREDYRRAGIVFLPVLEDDGRSTARQVLIATLLLIPVGLLPVYLSMEGWVYGIGALLLGLGYLCAGLRFFVDRTASRAREVLLASVIYLPLLYGLLGL
ncbi:MAG: heme o synthase [Bryobacteraceae bacterium]